MNKTMIVCIDFDRTGHRYITDIMYDANRQYIEVKKLAKDANEYHHEVYMVDIDNYNSGFITAIRLKGDQI